MLTKLKTTFATVFCAILVAGSFYLMAFGGALLCCAPIYPGGRPWQTEKFFYGLLPLFVSVVTLAIAFRLSRRAYVLRRNRWLGWCFVAVFAIALDCTLFLKYSGRQDERIRLAWNDESGAFSWGPERLDCPPDSPTNMAMEWIHLWVASPRKTENW